MLDSISQVPLTPNIYGGDDGANAENIDANGNSEALSVEQVVGIQESQESATDQSTANAAADMINQAIRPTEVNVTVSESSNHDKGDVGKISNFI